MNKIDIRLYFFMPKDFVTAYEIYQNIFTINASHVVSTALTVAAIIAGGWTVGLALGATYLAGDLISRGFYSVSLDNQINSWAHQNIGIRGSINIGFTIKYDF